MNLHLRYTDILSGRCRWLSVKASVVSTGPGFIIHYSGSSPTFIVHSKKLWCQGVKWVYRVTTLNSCDQVWIPVSNCAIFVLYNCNHDLSLTFTNRFTFPYLNPMHSYTRVAFHRYRRNKHCQWICCRHQGQFLSDTVQINAKCAL